MNATMLVSQYIEYGTPDVLRLAKIEKPVPKENELLIRVFATTVSAVDCHFRRGNPFSTRLLNGLTKPKLNVLGSTLVGEIEAVGTAVTLFKKGDIIFGGSDMQFAAHAEYKCLAEDEILALKPANLTNEEAASLPDALTPLYFLRELANVQPGQSVLINGAAGGIGVFAVQLANYFGATVTAVCSSRNFDLVKSLGADTTIDYNKEDFTTVTATYDVIFDAVAKSSFSRCKKALKPNGIYMTTDTSLAIFWHMFWTSLFGNKRGVIGFAGLNQTKEALLFIKELAEKGELKAVIGRRYPLAQMHEAHKYVETGHKTGTAVVTIN